MPTKAKTEIEELNLRQVTVQRDRQSPVGIFHTPQIDLLAFPYHYEVTLHVDQLVGGTPNNPDVADGWLRKVLGEASDDQIRAAAAQLMVERGITMDEATKEVKKQRIVNGFKFDDKGLYYEGRCAKAALREAVGVAVGAGKIVQRGWGKTQKWINAFLAEHLFVVERKIYLGRFEPDGVEQQFVHGNRGSSIKYEEFCNHVDLTFHLITDVDFESKEVNAKSDLPFWAMLWRTGELQGVGASRSQGYGVYTVTQWERVNITFVPETD